MSPLMELMKQIRRQLPGTVDRVNLTLTKGNILKVHIMWEDDFNWNHEYSDKFVELSDADSLADEIAFRAMSSYRGQDK